jgi:Cu-Zn family superoxide dismutase
MFKTIAIVCFTFAFATAWGKSAPITINLKDVLGNAVGDAKITSAKKGVKVALNLHGLPPGEHAIHFHEVGVCEGNFTTAKAHLASPGQNHGFKHKGGPHAGDLPNITVGADGKVNTTIAGKKLTLAAKNKRDAASISSAALIVHAKPDDYKTQPSGGDRIACGVVPKT